jgi:hypothetical protein
MKFILFILLASLSTLGFAEQKIVQGQYEIHYSIFPSTAISPEVAAIYQIKRSKYRGLVNITPQMISSNQNNEGVKAKVSGRARNLLSNQQELIFKEIIEGSVIYYLAEFSYSNEEHFRFKIDLVPENSSETISINFEKKFYVD